MKRVNYEELFGPEVGPQNPFETLEQRAIKNMPSSYIESAHINEYNFENQRAFLRKSKKHGNNNPSDTEGFFGFLGK